MRYPKRDEFSKINCVLTINLVHQTTGITSHRCIHFVGHVVKTAAAELWNKKKYFNTFHFVTYSAKFFLKYSIYKICAKIVVQLKLPRYKMLFQPSIVFFQNMYLFNICFKVKIRNKFEELEAKTNKMCFTYLMFAEVSFASTF